MYILIHSMSAWQLIQFCNSAAFVGVTFLDALISDMYAVGLELIKEMLIHGCCVTHIARTYDGLQWPCFEFLFQGASTARKCEHLHMRWLLLSFRRFASG
jgi:hypothetical protein